MQIVCDGVGDVKKPAISRYVPDKHEVGPKPLYIEILAPYNPRVFHAPVRG
jgi:hypothetical protein